MIESSELLANGKEEKSSSNIPLTAQVLEGEALRRRMIRYRVRLREELRDIEYKLKDKRAYVKREKGRMGHGGPTKWESHSSSVRDIKMDRRIEYVSDGRVMGRRPPSELEWVDVENVKMRVFSAEFPRDPYVTRYWEKQTVSERLELLVHIVELERSLEVVDVLDLNGVDLDYLAVKLREAIDGEKDYRERGRCLALAVKLREQQKVVKKPAGTPEKKIAPKDIDDALRKQFDAMNKTEVPVANSRGEIVEAEVN